MSNHLSLNETDDGLLLLDLGALVDVRNDFWPVVDHARRFRTCCVFVEVMSAADTPIHGAYFTERIYRFVFNDFSVIFFAYLAAEEHADRCLKLMNEELKYEMYSLFDPETVSSRKNYVFNYALL